MYLLSMLPLITRIEVPQNSRFFQHECQTACRRRAWSLRQAWLLRAEPCVAGQVSVLIRCIPGEVGPLLNIGWGAFHRLRTYSCLGIENAFFGHGIRFKF